MKFVIPKISEWREIASDLLHRAGASFLPDLMPPPERGDHKEASALLERGRKYYNRKNYEKAEEYFRRALFADESYVRGHYFLGLALYKRDNADAAVKAWKRAVQINPSDSFASKAESKIRYVQNHMNRAINELEGRIRRK